MTPGPARAFFEAIAGRYDRVYALQGEVSKARVARVVAELAPKSDVLDLGVGTGRELSALLDAGHRPVGVDFAAAMLAQCNRRARPIPVVEADFWEPLPFRDASFDAAIALHGTLAHPPDDGALVRLERELARVLRPRAVVIAEVPSPGWLDRLEGAAADASMRLRRTGPDRCVHEDLVAGRAVEAVVLGEERWRRVFSGWDVGVEPMSQVEMRVVARRG
jgi:SAM-dependent methyltransferase